MKQPKLRLHSFPILATLAILLTAAGPIWAQKGSGHAGHGNGMTKKQTPSKATKNDSMDRMMANMSAADKRQMQPMMGHMRKRIEQMAPAARKKMMAMKPAARKKAMLEMMKAHHNGGMDDMKPGTSNKTDAKKSGMQPDSMGKGRNRGDM
jgi:hypothetical protein